MIDARKNFAEQAKNMNWRFQDMVDGTVFQTAASAALVQMAITNANPSDMATAASYAWRMEGAKQFLAIFMGLVSPAPQGRKPLADANLNHRLP